ncbi:MAG TPA: response regulator transcription factor [Actinomycetota bacterium]
MSDRIKVLVVEDDAPTRLLIHDVLDLEGYQVSAVADGLSALQAVRQIRPDAIVLDAMIPGMDGFSVLKEIRADSSVRDTPVVMLTAMDGAHETWEGWKSGCDYYMTKPFEPEDLTAVVRRLALGAGV